MTCFIYHYIYVHVLLFSSKLSLLLSYFLVSLDLYISISDAVLGTSKEIDTVNGKVRIKIEQGVQSGKILRLRNKGIPSINSYGTGDLLVHINVWTPKTLNKEQKEFFKKMIDDDNFDPKPEKGDKSFFEKVKDMFS